MGWGEGGDVTDVVEDSYPPTICHTCAASEAQLLSKTDQEIRLHLSDGIKCTCGCGSDLWAVYSAAAASPCALPRRAGRGTRLYLGPYIAVHV